MQYSIVTTGLCSTTLVPPLFHRVRPKRLVLCLYGILTLIMVFSLLRRVRTQSSGSRAKPIKSSMTVSTIVIAAATLITKVISLLREWLMAAYFGTTLREDAWLMASVIPNRLFAAIDSGLSNVLVPTLAGAEAEYSAGEITQFLGESFSLVTLAALLLVVLGYAFTVPLIHLIAPSFSGLKFRLTVSMARILLPTILFWSWNGYFVGILRSHEAFAASSTASIITSILRVASIPVLVVAFALGVRGVAYGFTFAVFCQTVYLVAAVRRLGVAVGWRPGISHPLTRRLISLAPPFLMSSSVTTTGVLVDRILASSLVTGSIAALNYSQVLSQLPSAVLLQSLAQPIFTRLSSHWNSVQRADYEDLLARGFILVAAVVIPVALTFLLLPGPILAAIYEHGRYSAHSRALTLKPLWGWALGIPAAGYGTYLSRALFAQRKNRAITWISLCTIGFNITADLLLIHPLKAFGLALATSLAWWLRASLLGISLRRSLGAVSRPMIDWAKLGWLAIAMAAFSAIDLGLPHLLAMGATSHGWPLIFRLAIVLLVSWGLYLFALIKVPILDPRDRARLQRMTAKLRR